jgi:hypothetical protein
MCTYVYIYTVDDDVYFYENTTYGLQKYYNPIGCEPDKKA